MEWYIAVLKKYVDFNGRARRAEYWWFVLFTVIVSLVLGAIDALIFGTSLLGPLYSLAVLLPSLGVLVRRLHDTNRSGWWILISFVPLVGFIVLLVFLVAEGTKGPNNFGNDPKEA
ncbi:DUF805 domain-containing protein [Zavarzinia compransoris]|uniref:DUF805 domain-containing protein n=1 Tax=Zavarzinia compransoris TaxID=1264899 RepID=A0A317E261_9PROT|nr:DUF805 domain-containing protein [Zavarzinia compransoris]PWR20702.1 DUF805 domain-containing protein [Zavarzinia compransoris]TDP44473.1 uncharacterized membrane protein YhaH (DUF805 family) [Zavarzinia compransoris]